jgi:thymidylate synthase ThyX
MNTEHYMARMSRALRRCDCPPETEHVSGCPELTAEPSWLDLRRDERGIIPHPVPSREWGDDTEHALTRDVAFNRHSMNDGEHVGPSDNGKVQIGTDGIEVVLVQGIDVEALKRTLSMATRATIGLDISKGLPGDWEHCQAFCDWYKHASQGLGDAMAMARPDFTCGLHDKHEYKKTQTEDPHYRGRISTGDWEEMLKGGLQTALESQVIVFAVSGASRTCTHQLVRSRRAAFHQQSQRASYMGDMPECRMPESIWRNPQARNAFLRLTMKSWSTYQELCDMDISYQDARFALLEGTTNFILLEYPVREFLNVYAYRGCSMFQWEIVHVMRECRRVLIEAHPFMEPYVKISCEKTGPAVIGTEASVLSGPEADNGIEYKDVTVPHHCTFQGWEDVEGQCDFPWAKHEARTFKPEHHRISRKDGEDA